MAAVTYDRDGDVLHVDLVSGADGPETEGEEVSPGVTLLYDAEGASHRHRNYRSQQNTGPGRARRPACGSLRRLTPGSYGHSGHTPGYTLPRRLTRTTRRARISINRLAFSANSSDRQSSPSRA